MQFYIQYIRSNGACYPGGLYWDYYPGALSWSHITASHLKMESTGAQSLNELQRLQHMRGDQDSSPSDGIQGDMPYCAQSPCSVVFHFDLILVKGTYLYLNHYYYYKASNISHNKYLYLNHYYYHKASNIRHQIPKLKCFSLCLAVVFVQSIEARC